MLDDKEVRSDPSLANSLSSSCEQLGYFWPMRDKWHHGKGIRHNRSAGECVALGFRVSCWVFCGLQPAWRTLVGIGEHGRTHIDSHRLDESCKGRLTGPRGFARGRGGENGAYSFQGPDLCGPTVMRPIGSAPVRRLLMIESRSAKISSRSGIPHGSCLWE